MRQTKVVVTRYGGPEVITVAEQECPAPMPGEVRVKVLAAGVTRPAIHVVALVSLQYSACPKRRSIPVKH